LSKACETIKYHTIANLVEEERLKASTGILTHRVQQPKSRKPGISDIAAAGRLLGLDENDIRMVYNVSRVSKLKQHLTRSFLLFLFSLLAVVIVAFALSKLLQSSVYLPVIPHYGVQKKESIRSRFLFRGALST
jgi:hypothetical protein